MEEEKQGKHWYVIHTYSGYENKVRANLERKVHSLGMENEIFRIEIPTEKEVEIFLDDVCTIKEIQDMSQRLHVAKMLSDGKVFNEICGVTGSSSATISRVNKCLMYGDGGYNLVLDRMKDNQ